MKIYLLFHLGDVSKKYNSILCTVAKINPDENLLDHMWFYKKKVQDEKKLYWITFNSNINETSIKHLPFFARLFEELALGISFLSYSLLTRKGGYNYTLIAIKLRLEINHRSGCLEGGRWVTLDPGFCVASRVYKATSAETDVLWVLSRRKQTCYFSSQLRV